MLPGIMLESLLGLEKKMRHRRRETDYKKPLIKWCRRTMENASEIFMI